MTTLRIRSESGSGPSQARKRAVLTLPLAGCFHSGTVFRLRRAVVLVGALFAACLLAARARASDPFLDEKTDECDITAPELIKLAEDLHHSPVDILNWVCNEITTEVYAKSRKGALTTYYTGGGNNWDKSSLLITLLRISGIPARYALRGETPYVEACVPEKAVSGASTGGASLWVPLVPWISFVPATGAYGGLNLFPKGVIPAELNFSFKDYRASFNVKDPIELFEEQIQAYLKQNYNGKSLADVGLKRNIIPWDFHLLPAVLPELTWTGTVTTSATVPEDYRAWVEIRLQTTAGFTRTKKLYLAQIASKALVLDAPVSEANCVPVLKLDGEALTWVNVTGSLGATESFVPVFTFSDRTVLDDGTVRDSTVQARPAHKPGVLAALNFDVLSASARWARKLKSDLNLATYPASGTREQQTAYLAKAATFLANGYFLRWQNAVRRTDELLYCLHDFEDMPCFVQIYAQPDLVAADPSDLTPLDITAPWHCDAAVLNHGGLYTPDGQPYAVDSPINLLEMDLSGYASSKNEAAIFEDFQGSPALSTVAGLMAANKAGIGIAEIHRDDSDPTKVSYQVGNGSVESYDLQQLKGQLCRFALNTNRSRLRSGPIDDDQFSAIEYTATLGPGTISFDYAVSSEEGHDFLDLYIFYTDAQGLAQRIERRWAGEMSGHFSFTNTLSARSFKLRWVYEKDDGAAVNADMAWIDNVSVPVVGTPGVTFTFEAGESFPGPGWNRYPDPNGSGSVAPWSIVTDSPLPDELDESTVDAVYSKVCAPVSLRQETTVIMPVKKVTIEKTYQNITHSLTASVRLERTITKKQDGHGGLYVYSVENAYLYDPGYASGTSSGSGGASMDLPDYALVNDSDLTALGLLDGNSATAGQVTGQNTTSDGLTSTGVASEKTGWVERLLSAVADPIDPVSGEFYAEELPDIAIAAPGADLSVQRTYRSRIDYHGPFGEGWAWNHGEMLVLTTDGGILYYDERQTAHRIKVDPTTELWTYPPGADFRIQKFSDGTYTVTEKDLTQLKFKSDGRLHRKMDRNGNFFDLAYGANNLPVWVSDRLLRRMTFTYDTVQTTRVACVTDPLNRKCWYVYGGANSNAGRVSTQLTTPVQTALATALRQAAGLPEGTPAVTSAVALGDAGDLVAYIDLGGNVTVYKYLQNQTDNPSNNHNLCTYFLPNGDYLEVGYFKNDTVSYHRNAKGDTFHFQYSFLNRYAETWNESGYFRKIFWDEGGNVTRISTEDKTIESKTFDVNHNCLTSTDGNGYKTTFEYTDENGIDDGRNTPKRITTPDGGVRRYKYFYAGTTANDFFRLVSLRTSDPKANAGGVDTPRYVTETAFTNGVTNQGNIESITYPAAADGQLQRRTAYTYDKYGNRTSAVEQQGTGNSFFNIPYTYTTRDYDPTYYTCLPKKETDGYGNVTQYAYDGAFNLRIGRVATVTRPDGSRTAFEYNALGQITLKKDYRDLTYTSSFDTEFSYDCNRQLVATIIAPTAPNRAVTTNLYDISRDIVSGAQIAAVVDPLGYEDFREYDAVGNLIRQTDRNGNVTTFEYDGLKRLVARTDALGNRTTFDYDGNGNLITQTDARDNTTRFEYDAMNRRTKVWPPSVTPAFGDSHTPKATEYAYDLNGNLEYETRYKAETDAAGVKTRYEYDRLNRLVTKTINFGGAETRVWHYEYDVLGRITREIGPSGHYTQTEYDSPQYGLRNVVTSRYEKVSDGVYQLLARTITLADELGRPKQTIDPRGNSHYTEYDPLGRKSREYDDSGPWTEYVYDDVNNLSTLRVRDSVSLAIVSETRYAYSLRGERTRTARVLQVPDGGPEVELATGAVHDPNGNRIVSIDEDGFSTVTGYDALNRKITVTDPLDNTSVFEYDANSNLTTVFDPAQGPTDYGYDELNRQTWALDPSYKMVTADYDDLGRVLARKQVSDRTTGDGIVTRTLYNAFGEPWTVTEAEATPDQAVTEYHYTPDGQPSTVTDANTHTLGFAYDGAGRVILETDADGVTTRETVRDAAGNPMYEVRRDGTVIGREFDTLNRLTSVWTLPVATATNPAVRPSTLANAVKRQTFEYDALSRLVRAVDHNDPTTTKDDRETRYAYDSLGHIVSETEDDKAVLSYWDARSNRSALTYPGGRTVTIERDAATRPITVTDDGSAEAFALEYDAASRLTCVRSPGLQQRFSYYDNGSEWQRHFDLKTGASYTNFAWLDVTGYDFRNLANADRRILPNLQSTSTYGYDNRGNLTAAATTGAAAATRSWTLDKTGNWQTRLVVPPSGGPGTTTTYTPNADNEYTAIDATTPTYDANGNLTAGTFPRPLGEGQGEGTQMTFAYDWANRLVAVTVDGVTVATYTYDAFNRRVTATTADGVTRSVYDGSRLIEEYNDRRPAAGPVRAYVYGVGRVPVFSVDAAGTARYLLTDRQGSVVALTDAAGNVQELYRYTPYGEMTVCSASGPPLDTRHSTLNPAFGFTGQRFDPESGLWDFRNRAYSSELGRFLQRDPAGFVDGYNIYLYCRNSPVNYTDPDGRTVRIGGAFAAGFAEGAWNEATAVATIPYRLGNVVHDQTIGQFTGQMVSPLGQQMESMARNGASLGESYAEYALIMSGYRTGNAIYEDISTGSFDAGFSANMASVGLLAGSPYLATSPTVAAVLNTEIRLPSGSQMIDDGGGGAVGGYQVVTGDGAGGTAAAQDIASLEQAQRLIDHAVKEYLPDLKLSVAPTYDPLLEVPGRSLLRVYDTGEAVPVYSKVGPESIAKGYGDVVDTIVHEESHLRWPSLTEAQVEALVKRYFQKRGW
ncbi:MAG: hypothetical protein A3K19_09300 [Lentisphaerae bacterium RIFOXYB12_FULL_65_16]|nr:MAG: hypothetical protein A3K18_24520 [Lentisphaerae bacterium RIFOXYA12_64_32]OGV90446.1 MAG: hypothetical protein A3K19_09300 [Lentisphaerae bacterium RIFOXYB12_FULL_65_16]